MKIKQRSVGWKRPTAFTVYETRAEVNKGLIQKLESHYLIHLIIKLILAHLPRFLPFVMTTIATFHRIVISYCRGGSNVSSGKVILFYLSALTSAYTTSARCTDVMCRIDRLQRCPSELHNRSLSLWEC